MDKRRERNVCQRLSSLSDGELIELKKQALEQGNANLVRQIDECWRGRLLGISEVMDYDESIPGCLVITGVVKESNSQVYYLTKIVRGNNCVGVYDAKTPNEAFQIHAKAVKQLKAERSWE
jgi:hypothetical protein